MSSDPQIVDKIIDTLKGPATDALELAGDRKEGELHKLYANKYKKIFLQYPLNVESPEENHWVRFDAYTINGDVVKYDESRTGVSIKDKKKKKSFLDKVSDGVAEKASALVTTALMAPVNIAKSTTKSFLNDLPPAIGGIAKKFLGMKGKSRVLGKGSIMLYAPHTHQENLKYNWAQEATGFTGGALKGAGANDDNQFIQSLIDNAGTATKQLGALMGGAMTGNQSLVDLIGRNNGVANNPHLEMFFKSVDFRSFNFDFKLAPRNPPEAREIQKIVNFLKYASAPHYKNGEGGIYFAYPYVFDVSFFNESQTHKIARSALTAITVNHTAAGVNTTFYDNFPAETSLNLTFTELEIMHKDTIASGY
jgi:hypothetical protein